MIVEWIIIGGLSVAVYILIYKYEKKMEKLQQMVKENREDININRENIKKSSKEVKDNQGALKEHYNHIEKLWISVPKQKNTKKDDKNN